ncbi:Dynein light chain Tctex-type, variant 2, partial [Schistosoma haematobium]
TTFVSDEVKNIVKESIESIIGSSSYSHSKVQQWTSSVIEQCLSQLTKLGKPFKYIGMSDEIMFQPFSVTCVIMQKSGAGLHTASSCYWDSSTDGVHCLPVTVEGEESAPPLEMLSYDHVYTANDRGRKTGLVDMEDPPKRAGKPCFQTNGVRSCTVKWENKSMYFIVTVFGLAI